MIFRTASQVTAQSTEVHSTEDQSTEEKSTRPKINRPKKIHSTKDHVKHRKWEPEGVHGRLDGCNRNLRPEAAVAKVIHGKD